MGRGGDFNIRYKVWTEQLAAQLRQGEEMVRASSQRMTAASMPTVGRTLNKEEIASQQVLNQSLQATTGARKAATAEKKEQRQAQAQANRETERAARALKRQGAAMSDSQKLVRHFTLALRRMVLWWTTAAVLLGAQKLTKEIVTVAAAFQLVVKELTVLGNEGEQVYRRLAAAAIDTASNTGRSFDEAADALKGWIRQGYSAVEAADLMRSTLIGLNLTQLSSTELVRTMTAVMRAFNIPAADSISVIDKLIGVSRRYAIETGQLATGIRRFAASAKVANVTLDEQIGVMTAMMVRTQQSAQMVGRAGRTIFTRMRRNAVEALETIAKVQVFTDESRQSFRSMWQVLSDLAGTWHKLTEAQREEIAFQAAGLRQREFFLALMADFRIAQEANIVSLGSVGLAYKSNALLVNTLSKSITGLKTAWTGVLSQQTGILGFISGLVDGLRSLLEVSDRIPEALIAIGAVLPGLIALGVALFSAWSPTLLLNIIAIAGAITGLVWALGKLQGADVDTMIQEAKDLSDIMLQEAINTRKLAGEFISLRDAENAAVDNTDLLIKTREAIDRLYPDLLRGEEDLDKVYNILEGSLGDLTRRTVELTEARKELLRIELEQQEMSALGTILERRAAQPSGFEGELIQDPEDVKASLKEVRAHLRGAQQDFRDLAQDSIAYLVDMRRLVAAMGKPTEDRSDAEKDLVDTYKKEILLIRALRIVSAGRIVMGVGGLSDEKIIKSIVAARVKDVETAKKSVQWLLSLEKAYILVRQAREKLVALDKAIPGVRDTDGGGGLGTVEPNPAVRKAIKEDLDLLAEQLTTQRKIDQIASGIERPLNDQVVLNRLINDEQIKYLKGQIAITTGAVKLGHLREALLKIDVGSVHWQQLYNAELDSHLDILDRIRSEEEKAERDRLRRLTREERDTAKRKKLQKDITDAELDTINRNAAANIEASQGRVAALLYLRDVAAATYTDAQKHALRLAATEAPTPDVVVALREQYDAYTALQKANTVLRKAEGDRAREAIELADKRLGIDEQRATRTTALLIGDVSAAQQALGFAERRLETVKSRSGELRKQGAVAEASLAVDRARADLAVARIRLEKEIGETGIELADTLFGIEVERLRTAESEVIAAEMILARRKEILELAKKDETPEGRQKQLEAEIEVTKAQVDVDKARNKAREDFEKKMNRLLEEGAEIDLNRQVSETTLREGKLAGLNKELELLNLAESAAEKITDEYEKQLTLQEILNRRKEVEGDITDTNIAIQQRAIQQFIQLAGQQVSAAVQGTLSGGPLVQGVAGIVAGLVEASNPIISGIVLAAGSVLGALFDDPAEDLSDSLERNTTAIDRNTQTLQDVFAQRIGVPTGFALPASIMMQGALPGGGSVTTVSNQIDIHVDGRGQDAEQIARTVEKRLDKRFSINSRRGFGSNVYALG